MTVPAQQERIAFWKHAYARAAFVDACNFSKHLIESKLENGDIRRKYLTIAITVAYCRPFKQRPSVKLADDIVPVAFRETHDSLIFHRDKTIAHRDIGGTIEDWGFVGELIVAKQGRSVSFHTRSPHMSDEMAAQVMALSEELAAIMDERIAVFLPNFESYMGKEDSAYVLNLESEPESWLMPVQV